MFHHIWVPVDYTEKNRHALEIAINLAAAQQGKVSVLHGIELIAGTAVEEISTFYAALTEQAQQKMAALVAPYSDQPVTLAQKIVFGNRVPEIIRFAQEQAIDLIVMNSHKLDWNQPTQDWGTISYKVSILTQCPVLLVK